MLRTSVAELDLALDELEGVAAPDRVLLADPRDFDCLYAINPHMRDSRGELKRVDRELARRQWLAMRDAFAESGLRVDVVEPLDGHPDLVFCANQVLPFARAVARDGKAFVVPARMAHAERRAEVPHVVRALERLGYRVAPLQGEATRFEGMGDGLWHPRRRLLWAGCGPRSSIEAWREIASRHELPVIALELVDPTFYHLDTALAPLSEDACLWFPSALSPRSRELVRKLFRRTIEADEREARELLACNAFAIDGGRVFVERSAARTIEKLRENGFDPVGLDTSEFLKAGGSVFCMKLAHGPIG